MGSFNRLVRCIISIMPRRIEAFTPGLKHPNDRRKQIPRKRWNGKAPVIIDSDWSIFLIATLVTMLGIVGFTLLYYKGNSTWDWELSKECFTIWCDQCPAFNGRIRTYVRNMSILLVLYGVLGYLNSGIISQFFLLLHLRDEAICCGQIFMGMFGKILRSILYFV